MADSKETATLEIHGTSIELPLIVGRERETGIDIRHLRAKTGAIAFDPGFANTASCTSSITYIDGEKGILRYRGIPIEEFEHQPNFARVAWLLIFGDLPTDEEYARFSSDLTHSAGIDEAMKNCRRWPFFRR